jgi:hypothetical protein
MKRTHCTSIASPRRRGTRPQRILSRGRARATARTPRDQRIGRGDPVRSPSRALRSSATGCGSARARIRSTRRRSVTGSARQRGAARRATQSTRTGRDARRDCRSTGWLQPSVLPSCPASVDFPTCGEPPIKRTFNGVRKLLREDLGRCVPREGPPPLDFGGGASRRSARWGSRGKLTADQRILALPEPAVLMVPHPG